MASNSSTVIENTYDYMGRRIKKIVTETSPASVTTNTFVYDGWSLISESEISNGQSAITNLFVYGLDLSGSLQGAGTIGGILSADLNGSSVYYCYDANGNVAGLVDTNAGIVAHYEYDPYGQTTKQTGTLSSNNPFRFSTKYQDESELYYYGYRFYGPALGRWINRDPLREWGGVNLYGFLYNRTLNSLDVLGLWDLDWGQNEVSGAGTVCRGPAPANIVGQPIISLPTGCDANASPPGTKKDGDEYDEDCALPCDLGPAKGVMTCRDKLECQKMECTAEGLDGVYYYDWVIIDKVCGPCN